MRLLKCIPREYCSCGEQLVKVLNDHIRLPHHFSVDFESGHSADGGLGEVPVGTTVGVDVDYFNSGENKENLCLSKRKKGAESENLVFIKIESKLRKL